MRKKSEEQDKMEVPPKGNRRLVLLIFSGMLLLGVLVASRYTSVQMYSGNKSQTQEASPATSLEPKEALLAFAQCMRDNRLPNFPDPTDDGISLSGTRIDLNTPEFKAAQEACKTLLPQPSSGISDNSAWQKVVPGGDCECADGSEFAFFEHRANPAKVVFYLDGGGVCFDAASCANANTANTGERAGLERGKF
jgi:hypothetical protein